MGGLACKYSEIYRSIHRLGHKKLFLRGWPSNRFEALLVSAHTGQSVLVIGCGNGFVLWNLREQYRKLYGIELSTSIAKEATATLNNQASERLIHKYVNAHLILVGQGEERGKDKIIKPTRENGILTRILITGLISGDEKLDVLQDSNVFVLPSRFEGPSIALLEALHFSLPIITTDKVDLSEDIHRIGAELIVPSESKKSICKALIKLADNKIRSSMQGRGIILILEKYTWDKIVCNLVEQIQELIS